MQSVALNVLRLQIPTAFISKRNRGVLEIGEAERTAAAKYLGFNRLAFHLGKIIPAVNL